MDRRSRAAALRTWNSSMWSHSPPATETASASTASPLLSPWTATSLSPRTATLSRITGGSRSRFLLASAFRCFVVRRGLSQARRHFRAPDPLPSAWLRFLVGMGVRAMVLRPDRGRALVLNVRAPSWRSRSSRFTFRVPWSQPLGMNFHAVHYPCLAWILNVASRKYVFQPLGVNVHTGSDGWRAPPTPQPMHQLASPAPDAHRLARTRQVAEHFPSSDAIGLYADQTGNVRGHLRRTGQKGSVESGEVVRTRRADARAAICVSLQGTAEHEHGKEGVRRV